MRAASYGLIAAAISSAATALPLAARQGGNGTVECAPIPSPFPTWQELPLQTSLPDPFLPLRYTTTDNAGSSPDFARDVMTGRGRNRVQTPEEWYRCRRPEILQMLQEYQYGYYPDHSQETVQATRSGNMLDIAVTAGGKTGRFRVTITLPPGASASKPAPVVISIGWMQSQQYLNAGIAIAQFDYTSVAPDSNAKTGAFWSIYDGRDIGEYLPTKECICRLSWVLFIPGTGTRIHVPSPAGQTRATPPPGLTSDPPPPPQAC